MSKMKKFIDIGANLTDLMYMGLYNGSKKHDEDLNFVLNRSWDVGLDKIIITGGNLEESIKAIDMAKTDDRLYVTVGCHPTRCLEFENDDSYLDKLKNLVESNRKKVVAVGECGLDYDRTQFCPIDVQKKYLNLQLKLSEELNLPLFLHCRNAGKDLYDILKSFDNLKGVVHSFDGSLEDAQNFIELGYFIGINGCSLKTKENLEVVAQLPVDKIMVETDCPWCEIRPSHAGYSLIAKENLSMPSFKKEKWQATGMVKSRNEPMNILHVVDVISSIRKEDKDILTEKIYNNTVQLFFA